MTFPLRPVVLALIFLAAITLYFQSATNSDFLAVYLAGLSYADGTFDQVYPALIPVFDLSYPQSWDTLARAQGVPETTKLYPFIYPPLWAAVASWFAPAIGIDALSTWLPAVNASLLLGCSWLGWRITRTDVPFTLWLSIGVLTMATTTYGYVALAQGQPQILTSFLILLAIERARANAPLTAGGCLALAASIKLYPLVFVALWLARKEWRAVASFATFGAVLAICSLALAGWPLHQAFLAQIGVISNSVLVTPLSYNFSALVTVFTNNVFDAPLPYTSAASANVSLVNKLALIAVLGAASIAAMRASTHRLYTCIWPMLLIAVSFFSPMSWSYHFLTALAFAPLVMSYKEAAPKLCLALLVCASSIAVALAIGNGALREMVVLFAGFVSLLTLTACFVFPKPVTLSEN